METPPKGPCLPASTTLAGPALLCVLGDMKAPPTEVALWGKMPPGPYVTIVGTRHPSPHGRRAAHRLARQLARAGVTIVSGGALGIDSAAHQGALSARGKTLVVGPTRLPEAYPRQNLSLFQSILSRGGAYLSLAPPGQTPFNQAFFLRNEAMVALSHAVVLGECPFKSGAKNAMVHARRMDRVRFVVPFPFDEARAMGAWDEVVNRGGRLLSGAPEILDLLSRAGSFENPRWWRYLCEQRELSGGDPSEAREARLPSSRTRVDTRRATSKSNVRVPPRVVSECGIEGALRRGATTVDEICEMTKIPVAEVQHRVTLLTLQGHVRKDAQGLLRYEHVPNS